MDDAFLADANLDDATLRGDLLETFAAELAERAAALDRDLAALEGDDGIGAARLLAELYACAYNLHGAALAVALSDVAHLAASLAAAFELARRPEVPITGAWFAAVRRAIAFLTPLAEAAQSGRQPAEFFDIMADLVAPAAAPSRSMPAPAPSPAAPREAAAPPAPAAGESVRVQVGKLDALLAGTGELTVARGRVAQRLAELNAARAQVEGWQRARRTRQRQRAALRRHLAAAAIEPALLREFDAVSRHAEAQEAESRTLGQQIAGVVARLRQDVAQLDLIAQDLADDVLAARLLPVATAFGPFERLVRDLAREQGKEIRLVLEGGETEIDRKILERLRDPLMHMLRNGVDHGLERPERRAAAGKARAGQLRVAVAQRGGAIEIVVADDGAGLDPAALRASAGRKGLLTAERAAALDEDESFALIFLPGFSTSPAVTATSGRGVGMDVVRDEVTRLGGHVRIASQLGQGTTFTITVPLTLATTRALLAEQSGQAFAIPSAAIERTARARPGDLVALEGRRAVVLDGQPVPVAELADVLALPRQSRAPDPRDWRPFVVLRQESQRLALLVDRLIGEQELVVKPLGWPLRRVRNIGGAAVLGSGETIAILAPPDLLHGGLRSAAVARGEQAHAPDAPTVPARAARRRVLVVDDSLTTRMLERGILESAGYDTVVASDGAEALGLLEREAIDLVVSDVEMPRLDGFGLTAAIRRDARLQGLPVVLVTSLDDPAHRERGMTAGADAYIGKGTFDQGRLLDTIGRLL